MKSLRAFPRLFLLLSVTPLLVQGCAPTVESSNFPPVADLKRTEAPQFDGSRIDDETYHSQFEIRMQNWGETSDAALGRLCTFFKDKGMKVDCTPQPDTENPVE